MRRIIHIVTVVGIASASLAACRSRSGGERAEPSKAVEPGESEPAQPHTALGEAAQDFAQKRDQYIDQMNRKLADLDSKIANLKKDLAARSGEAKSDTRSALADTVAKLEEKRVAAREALQDAKEATQSGWQQAKGKTDETLKSIDDAYQDAARQLRQ